MYGAGVERMLDGVSKFPVFVAIVTSGRAAVLNETLRYLGRQTSLPERVFVCPAQPADFTFPSDERLPFAVEVVTSPQGACVQRNAILDQLTGETSGAVLFLDDDFFPRADYVAETAALFQLHPDIALATGTVLADGAPGPGLTVADAIETLAADTLHPEEDLQPVYNGYGCNMAVRLDTVNRRTLRFDTELPLYAWLEDVDFSRRLATDGRLVQSTRLRGVHMGVKRGRSSGLRLGYSQIANPWYLMRKRTMRPDLAAKQALRNIAANLAKVGKPEPWVDRRGRVKGNLLALRDLLRGRLHPKNILMLG
ncbi:glycosyltransferase family 2 protein [Aureimonas sp. AU20]|uniref:glycosyltransferase family 2 protein n=1 Tax=Aureimonas sp. AU20 TaxID=1349819 RepID=UPI000ACDBE7B|nr:glycosyltransferase family 2 protein [Aureimonas sp. AU20]